MIKRKIRGLASAFLATALFAPIPALALPDTDGDLIPDLADSCTTIPNGPNQLTLDRLNLDCDSDGFGNRCDPDYDDSLTTTVADFAVFLGSLGTSGACQETDQDGSGTTTVSDGSLLIQKFQSRGPANAPGPSGLQCAGIAPCRAAVRITRNSQTPPFDAAGIPNFVSSPDSYEILTFEIPAGSPGEIVLLEMEVGAPGGQCTNGAHCYADGRYAVAGWSSLAEAEGSPTVGTLFHLDVTNLLSIVEAYGSSSDGIVGGTSFPTSLISFETVGLGADCPATGCVVALVSDVSAAPGLVVETRPWAMTPGVGPTDRTLCPIGCEGGQPSGTASVRIILAP